MVKILMRNVKCLDLRTGHDCKVNGMLAHGQCLRSSGLRPEVLGLQAFNLNPKH